MQTHLVFINSIPVVLLTLIYHLRPSINNKTAWFHDGIIWLGKLESLDSLIMRRDDPFMGLCRVKALILQQNLTNFYPLSDLCINNKKSSINLPSKNSLFFNRTVFPWRFFIFKRNFLPCKWMAGNLLAEITVHTVHHALGSLWFVQTILKVGIIYA